MRRCRGARDDRRIRQRAAVWGARSRPRSRRRVKPSEVRLAARYAREDRRSRRAGLRRRRAPTTRTARASTRRSRARDVVLLISGVSANEQRIQEHRTAIDAAKAARVKRIVYTSYGEPDAREPVPVRGDPRRHRGLSRKRPASRYTILRNGPYAANLDGSLTQSKMNDLLASPAADAKVAYLTHRGCGRRGRRRAARCGARRQDLRGHGARGRHAARDRRRARRPLRGKKVKVAKIGARGSARIFPVAEAAAVSRRGARRRERGNRGRRVSKRERRRGEARGPADAVDARVREEVRLSRRASRAAMKV